MPTEGKAAHAADSPAAPVGGVPAVTQPEVPDAPPTEAPKDSKEQRLEVALFGAAKTFAERTEAYRLLSGYRQQKMIQDTAAALGGLSWGKDLSPLARGLVARYALETGTDATRHWYVLGGRMYDCAELYYDLCAANPNFLRADGGPGFELVPARLIHDDKRLNAEQRDLRAQARIAFGAPEETPGAAVVFLSYRNRGPFIGCNWVKVGQYANGKPKDPVGQEHPVQTAITRAYRKAAKKAEPIWFLHHPTLQAAEEVIVQGREISTLESGSRVELPDQSPTVTPGATEVLEP
jgi:hypothetical protein